MIKFNQDFTEMFLGVVRKYMQIRGGLSQKELAVKINIGISTMSRFMNQKTKEVDPQMIASIVAHLNIPLHEIIDFIAEESTATFKKLVLFHKESEGAEERGTDSSISRSEIDTLEEEFVDRRATGQRTTATIKGINVPFGEATKASNESLTMREKLNTLSPRQKGFLTDFLDLDMEGRDLIVDIGNSLYRYFKQGQAEF